MDTSEAVEILGMKWSEISDASTINRVWKKLVIQVHPDKWLQKGGGDSLEHATKMTQRLNEARDVLLERLHANAEFYAARKRREDQMQNMKGYVQKHLLTLNADKKN